MAARILLVHDDPDLLELLRYQLREFGYEPAASSSVEEALALFNGRGADLVISDLKVPGVEDGRLLEGLQGKENPVPLIVLVDPWVADRVDQRLREGTFDLLTKPFSKEELRHVVTNALKMGRLLQYHQALTREVERKEQYWERIGAVAEALETAQQLMGELQEVQTRLNQVLEFLQEVSRVYESQSASSEGVTTYPLGAPGRVAEDQGGEQELPSGEEGAGEAAPEVPSTASPGQNAAPEQGRRSSNITDLIADLEAMVEQRQRSREEAGLSFKAAPVEPEQIDQALREMGRQDQPEVPSGPPEEELPSSLSEKISREELLHWRVGGSSQEAEGLEKERGQSLSPLYEEARAYVLECIRRAEREEAPDPQAGLELLRRALGQLEEGPQLMRVATDRHQAFSVTAHSVNVALLSMAMARTLSLEEEQTLRVGLAGLLHEIGVVRLPQHLMFRQENLSAEELRTLRRRPLAGGELLRKLGSDYEWLAETVEQVYERVDGSGHPRGLRGEDIRGEAQLLGLVDVFEACIHQRPYRKAMTGYHALYELASESGRTFPDRLVKAMIKTFSLYPYNEYVLLNTGEYGRVVEIHPDNLARPVLEVFAGREGSYPSPRRVDLAQDRDLMVTQAVPPDALPDQAAPAR